MVKNYRAPLNPVKGQLFFDHPTGTMREWDGKHWAEKPKLGGARKILSTKHKGNINE